MVTPQLKDTILSFFTEKSMIFDLHNKDVMEKFNIDEPTFFALLEYFHDKGLIKYTHYESPKVQIQMTIKAHDFIHHGGFVVEEEILKGNIEKLGLEIDLLYKQLTPDQLERANKIATIGSAIVASLSLFK